MPDLKATVDHLVDWIVGHLNESGMQGLVVGVSGGVDSALSSALCALTGRPVSALSLPIHQQADQVSRADRHLSQLSGNYRNVSAGSIDLTDTFASIQAALAGRVDGAHALANTRSRLRMCALYAVAGQQRMLVCGTGNRVEDFGIGFFTKYGDGGVDISPLADLMKTEVYALARHIGVGEDILKAAPTDGLWDDDRSDEAQIGASYAELEWAMEFDGDAAALQGRKAEVMRRYRELRRLSLHKMQPIPICRIPAHLRPAAL